MTLPECAPGIPTLMPCPRCGVELLLVTFPALRRAPTTGAAAERVMEEGESGCFYHAGKRAVAPCDHCGRFLCALCSIELDGKHYCPTCLESATDHGSMRVVEPARTRYDQVVWSILILPLPLCMVVGPITATAALGLALWKWRAAPSLVSNTKLQLVLGMGLALVELGLVAWFWGMTVFAARWHVAK